MESTEAGPDTDFVSPDARGAASITDSASAASGGKVLIDYAGSVVIGDQVVVNYSATEVDTHVSGLLSKNDLLVTVVNEVLAHSQDGAEPLHELEQIICRKLRSYTGKDVQSFEKCCGFRFREFLDRNKSHFKVTKPGLDFMVSKAKKKGKKSGRNRSRRIVTVGPYTEEELVLEETCVKSVDPESPIPKEENVWQSVKSKRKATAVTSKCPVETPGETAAKTSTCEPNKTKSFDESFIEDYLNRAPGDTIIFKQSDVEYKHDRVQFTLDVVSLWNTPHRHRAFIILGVRPKTSLPHEALGLLSSVDDSFYQSLFLNHLFMLSPKFAYREVVYHGKRIGVIQVESNRGCGFPSIVLSHDLAPRLQKDQLWARKDGQNALISPSDFLVGQIHSCFLSQLPDVETKHSSLLSLGESSFEKEPADNRIPLETSTSASENEGFSLSKQIGGSVLKSKKLLKEVNDFKRGHFLLICGTLNTRSCRNIEALSYVPWIAAYDFDFMGRESGLLNILEDSIKKRRSLTVSAWCDPQHGITERATQWWSLRGRRDVPASKTSETSHKEWLSSVRTDLEKICVALERFSEDYTVLTALVLWPGSEVEARCMHEFLRKLKERVQAKIILCFTDQETAAAQFESKAYKIFQLDFEESIKLFQVNLCDLCTEIELVTESSRPTPLETFQYQLPSEDPAGSIFTEEDAAWLKQDLEVLYSQSQYTKKAVTAEDLRAESEKFYRGGAIDWYAWYDMGAGYLDVERSLSREITRHIREVFIKNCRNGMVTVFHAPGSGGSTMAQRILWDLHEATPCVQVKQRSGSSTEDVADKLRFLHDRTHLPVVALMDGEDEPRLKQLLMHLRRNSIITLYVNRYSYHIDESGTCNFSESKFYLPSILEKQESRNFVVRFKDRCCGDLKKVNALMKLDRDVQEDREKHRLFEYGMTVYDHEFQGVRAYVKGYLQLDKNQGKDLEPWQRCLGYLSLVYYYGQSSLPLQFFTSLMGRSPNYIMGLGDFPYCFTVFVVPDTNEGRDCYIRICHYLIAKEILEQILNRSPVKSQSICDRLSTKAKQNLKDFCISFISHAASKKSKRSLTAQTITYIMAKTFIFRDNSEVSDFETSGKQSRSKFSQIMQDMDSNPPFSGRLEVLQKLCETLPDDPNFRAHLGRFYTFCRPEEEEEAEKHFLEALRLCDKGKGRLESHEAEERSKLTFMHIFHMFGTAFQRRIVKYTGWKPDDKPKIRTKQEQFQERLDEVIFNANQACHYFNLAKYNTPSGHEDCYTYVNEIHVRLQSCDFVNKFYPGGLQACLSQGAFADANFAFIKDSVLEVQDLILECYNVVLLDNGLPLQMYVRWYNSLFGGCARELESFAKGEDLTSMRLNIAAKKLKFRRSDAIVSVESSLLSNEIDSLVRSLEEVIKYVETGAQTRDTSKRKLELDYKDWILAIRHPSYRKDYSLEQVLEQVRQWHGSVQSPQSTFYVFVLLSLLGFGTSTRPGNTDSLLEAQIVLEEKLPKFSRTALRPKWPREWLGKDSQTGIRRLVPSSSVGHIEDRFIKSEASRVKLAVCKGTICPKNTKRLAGYIGLDLGENNSTTVKVFYVPLLADLEGSRYAGERVEFHLAFTLENGYEAYSVKLLHKYQCSRCPIKVEMTSEQEEVLCSSCGGVVVKHSRSLAPDVTQETDQDT